MSLQKVKISDGVISGAVCATKGVTVFKGIPFAAPPVGDLRWREPQPVKPWNGTLKATCFKKICTQQVVADGSFYSEEFYHKPVPMSEDCLYLNVWTPAVSVNDKLPVMMWIHGGAFRHGFSYEREFDGEGFANKGVILVTISYRLGPLGFLAHPQLTEESPNGSSGNYGLLDQIAALKWIVKNIMEFGGDPENITVFGQSAGAISVQALMTSPLTKGLISKAVLQSGGGIRAFDPMLSLGDSEKNGTEFLEAFNIDSIEKMRELPADNIVEKTDKYYKLNITGRSGFEFYPNVDGYVLLEDISDAIVHNSYHDIPFILGSNKDEMRYILAFTCRQIKQAGKIEELSNELCHTVTDMCGNREADMAERFYKATRDWADIHCNQGRRPAYIYYFDRELPGDNAGAFHSGELWYVFETLSRSWRPFENTDYKISEVMSSYWTNFAKSGGPNGDGLPYWSSYTNFNPMVMELGKSIGTGLKS